MVKAKTFRDTLIEGFSQFVTSMTAPIASGWSDCRVGFSPTESAAFARRTPSADVGVQSIARRLWATMQAGLNWKRCNGSYPRYLRATRSHASGKLISHVSPWSRQSNRASPLSWPINIFHNACAEPAVRGRVTVGPPDSIQRKLSLRSAVRDHAIST